MSSSSVGNSGYSSYVIVVCLFPLVSFVATLIACTVSTGVAYDGTPTLLLTAFIVALLETVNFIVSAMLLILGLIIAFMLLSYIGGDSNSNSYQAVHHDDNTVNNNNNNNMQPNLQDNDSTSASLQEEPQTPSAQEILHMFDQLNGSNTTASSSGNGTVTTQVQQQASETIVNINNDTNNNNNLAARQQQQPRQQTSDPLEAMSRGIMLNIIASIVSVIVYVKNNYLPSFRSLVTFIRHWTITMPMNIWQCNIYVAICEPIQHFCTVRFYKSVQEHVRKRLMCSIVATLTLILVLLSMVAIVLGAIAFEMAERVLRPSLNIIDFKASLKSSTIVYVLDIVALGWILFGKLLRIYSGTTIANSQLVQQRNLTGVFHSYETDSTSSDDESSHNPHHNHRNSGEHSARSHEQQDEEEVIDGRSNHHGVITIDSIND